MEYGESNLTTFPVCPQERFSLYKFNTSAYHVCSKGLGHLLHLNTIYFPFFYFLVAYTRKHIKSYLSVLAVIPCPRSLVITFCSSLGLRLLLIKKAKIDPLYLWVISVHQGVDEGGCAAYLGRPGAVAEGA